MRATYPARLILLDLTILIIGLFGEEWKLRNFLFCGLTPMTLFLHFRCIHLFLLSAAPLYILLISE
jgi:hypothetical protein